MPGSVPYMMPGSYADTGAAPAATSTSGQHWGFIFWLIIFVLASLSIVQGLKLGGFSFVFRHR